MIHGLDAPPYFMKGELQQLREQMADEEGKFQ